MVDSAFIETSVYIGYCVTADQHHHCCNEYVAGSTRPDDSKLVSTDRVRNEYYRAKDTVVNRLTKEVQRHRQRVTRFIQSQDDPLDLPALENLVEQTLDSDMDIHRFMIDFYDEYPFVYHKELLEDLRELSREIERRPRKCIDDLDANVEYYNPVSTHDTIRSQFSRDPLFDEVESEDISICLEAHDLAIEEDEEVELATVNPRDFCDEGREDRILELTGLFSIRDLSANVA